MGISSYPDSEQVWKLLRRCMLNEHCSDNAQRWVSFSHNGLRWPKWMAFEIWDPSLSSMMNWIRGIYNFFKTKSNLQREQATACHGKHTPGCILGKICIFMLTGFPHVSATFWKGPAAFLESWILRMCAQDVGVNSSLQCTSSKKKSNLAAITFQGCVSLRRGLSVIPSNHVHDVHACCKVHSFRIFKPSSTSIVQCIWAQGCQ